MSILMDTETDFAKWLEDELEKREWSQSDLANKANINRQVISTYITRKRVKPDEDILKAIAKAFNVPPEIVFRHAGLLPMPKKFDEIDERVIHEMQDLIPQDKEELLIYIQTKKNFRKRK